MNEEMKKDARQAIANLTAEQEGLRIAVGELRRHQVAANALLMGMTRGIENMEQRREDITRELATWQSRLNGDSET